MSLDVSTTSMDSRHLVSVKALAVGQTTFQVTPGTNVPGLSAEISKAGDALRVGALTVLSDLMEDEQVRGYFPALVEAAGTVGSVQIRNRATV